MLLVPLTVIRRPDPPVPLEVLGTRLEEDLRGKSKSPHPVTIRVKVVKLKVIVHNRKVMGTFKVLRTLKKQYMGQKKKVSTGCYH